MSWKSVGQALRALIAAGDKGFEGVAARLLDRMTGISFTLARSGDQPSGDALSADCTTVLQAKRYRDNTSLKENEIVGDIYGVLDEVPDVEVYVLAVTRTVAQICSRLSRVADETSLDIVYLSYDASEADSTPPDLGALCAIYWNDISAMLVKSAAQQSPRTLKSHFDEHNISETWLLKQATDSQVIEIGERLRNEIVERLQTYRQLQSESKPYLSDRFGLSNSQSSRFAYSISLANRVPRNTSVCKLKSWWESKESKVAYIEGEEGTGKSWIAAEFSWNIASEQEVLCLWLDSDHWTNCNTLQQAIEIAIRAHSTNNQNSERLCTKALSRWKKPTLIVLDGVNERGAIDAARFILSDIFGPKKGHELRLLFTTRPLAGYPSYYHQLWKDCRKVECQGFDDVELERALSRENMKLDELPDSIKDVVRLPRYFKLCIELRDRLGTFSNVTKELVLWEDLKRKVEQTDPQVYTKLSLHSASDAEEILAFLSKNATIGMDQKYASISAELLNQCFDSGYSEIRMDLREQRIASQAGKFETQLNKDHLVLGWALHLKASVSAQANKDIHQIVDILRKELEPIPSEDWRTSGLFVAYSLTLTEIGSDSCCSSTGRAALLSTWYESHNMNYLSNRIRIAAEQDFEAYVIFVEKMFERIQISPGEVALIEPLARMWKLSQRKAELRQVLRSWLLLAWHPKLGPEDTKLRFEGIELPAARNETQLRLSSAAISILSQRADNEFLETLALTLSTLSASKSAHSPDWHSAKHCGENLGFIMRWVFTEECLEYLEKLEKAHRSNSQVHEGIQLLAAKLGLAELPTELRRPPLPPGGGISIYMNVKDALRDGEPLFEGPAEAFVGRPVKIGKFSVRKDFPQPRSDDLDLMRDAMQIVIQDHQPHSSSKGQRAEDWTMDSFAPWVARYRPDDFSSLLTRSAFKALAYDNPYKLLHVLPPCVPDWCAESQDAFIRCGKGWLSSVSSVAKNDIHGLRMVPNLLTELIVLGSDSARLCDWLVYASAYPALRDSILRNSIPRLLKTLQPEGLLEFAKSEARSTVKDNSGVFSHARYWIYIWAYVTPPDAETYQWAKEELVGNPPSEEDWSSLVGLLAASSMGNIWVEISEDRQLQDALARNRARCYRLLCYHAGQIPVEVPDMEGLRRAGIPTGIIGQVLELCGRTDELDAWANELWESVLELMRLDPELEIPRRRLSVQTDSDGSPPRYSGERKDSWSFQLGSSTGGWGVDSHNIRDMKKAMSSGHDDSSHLGDMINRIEEMDHLGILQFGNASPLKAWATRNTAKFVELADQYLECVFRDPMLQLKFGVFTDTIVRVLVTIDPKRAFSYWCEVERSQVKTNARGVSGAPALVEDIWSPSVDSVLGIREIRRQFFEHCTNDEEIMFVTCGALSVGGQNELLLLCENSFLRASVARDRCLGISILPWITNAPDTNRLEAMVAGDPSLWVRGHAAWALESARSERSCVQTYREALQECDARRTSALLHCIKPALLPSAKWWRQSVESEVGFWESCQDARKKAAVLSFWDHWGSSSRSKGGGKVAERKLSEYCRGEKLDARRTERLWPWWTV